MESTFDQFINSDPEQKELFDREYNAFLLSEFLLEKMEEEQINDLGYKINFERI